MRLCILCKNENVVEARQRAATALPKHEALIGAIELKKKFNPDFSIDHLTIPLSETGELPATHWFCFIKTDEEAYQRMIASQMHTVIEEAVPSEFLEKHGLKRIKSDWGK